MGEFCLLVDASYAIHTTKSKVDHNLWGEYHQDVQFCLKYPGNYTKWVTVKNRGVIF